MPAEPPSPPSPDFLPYARQSVDEDDIEAVARVLRSDWLTTGPAVDAFESALCEATGSSESVVVSSGTAALHAAYFGVRGAARDGDQLLTTPLTFFATASAALHAGMDVAFADVSAETGLLDPAAAEAALGERTRVIVPVDYTGHPADARAFEALAARRDDLSVVVDASHSLGASREGRRVGEVGDAATLSFHPVKPITTGEGGAVLSGHPEVAAAARRFRNHGMRRAAELEREGATAPAPWHYEIEELGMNYRLPDLNCALGLSQLGKLERFTERRRFIARRYLEAFASLGQLASPVVEPEVEPSWHLFVVRVREPERRRALYDALRGCGLGVQVHYEPVHLQPFFAERGYREGQFPAAEAYASTALSLPLFPAMTDADVERVIEVVAATHGEVL